MLQLPHLADLIDLADCVDERGRNPPDRVFIRTPAGRELTYAALGEETGRFVAALTACGVTPGDRVAVQVDKSVEAVLLYIACLRLGAVFVPINVTNTRNEVEYFLRDAQPRLAVVRPLDRESLEPLALRVGVLRVESLGADGDGSLGNLAMASPGVAVTRLGGADTVAAIVYTSGTTGQCKGAMLTRGNLASNAVVLARAWRFTGSDTLLHSLPLFHVHGLFVAINTVLVAGACLLLIPKFDAVSVLTLLPKVSVYMGVPTHYTRLLLEPSFNRCVTAGMRLFVSGSAPLLAETHHEFAQRTGHIILERYGMTETLMNTSNPYEGERMPGSVGPALPGISVRVATAVVTTTRAETEGAIGALEVKGPNVFAGYWRDPEKTRNEFTADGWFKTGDLGRIEADGYVTIVGRAKDLVISGGYNVYPKEVELELDAVPGVLESAVFGIAHADFGEAVTAALVRRPYAALTEREVIGVVKQRLSGYKVPKRVVFVDELPRNAMGKVQKNVLRLTYAALYRDD